MMRFCPRPLLPALALLAFVPARAAEEAKVIALPPFMVEELAKGPPWRYAQSPDFEILSRCSDGTTRELATTYHRLHRLLELILPPSFQLRHEVPKTMIFYDEALRPAASQEVIAQMLKPKNEAGSGDEPAVRGLRSFGTTAPRYTFVPNMRLWDKDMMSVFAIVRGGDLESDRLFLTPDYVSYLVKSRTPSLPAWFIAGFVSCYPHINFYRDTLTLEPAEWVSSAETRAVKADPKTARPLLPLPAFFRGDTSANAQTKEENLRVWAAQAELFYRWGLDAPERHAGFWKFVERVSRGAATEPLLVECFGADVAGVQAALVAFLPQAVRKSVTLRTEAKPLAALPLRNATDGEIARIRGDWERLEIAYVRARIPELAPKYVEQARRTLLRAYDRDDRDPRLLAILGLCEIEAGNDAGARDYLEAAAAIGVVRPRAWLELGRLRLAGYRAVNGPGGKLSSTQAAEVLVAVFKARAQLPVLPEVYELIADVWLESAVPPNAGHLAVVVEGVNFFPRRGSLIHRAAMLYLGHGTAEEAVNLIDLGAAVAADDAERGRFAELRTRLGERK